MQDTLFRHEHPALLQRVAPAIGSLGGILDNVGKCMLGHLSRVTRLLGRLVPEGRAEAVRGRYAFSRRITIISALMESRRPRF